MHRNLLKNLFITLILFFLSASSIAQFNIEQADSFLQELEQGQVIVEENNYARVDALIETYQSANDTCKYIRALGRKVHLEIVASEYENSMRTLIEMEKLFDESGCGDQILALIYLIYSGLYAALQEQAQADSMAQLGIALYDTSWKDISILIRLYSQLGGGDHDKWDTKAFLDTAIGLSREHNKPVLEQKALINMGTFFAIAENYEEAASYFQKALVFAKRRNNPGEMGVLYNNLAGLSSDPEEILLYIDTAIHYAGLANNYADLQTYVENKAFFYSTIGQYEEGYDFLWSTMLLKDSLLNIQKFEAIAEMQEKYDAEKKASEIKTLKLEKLSTEIEKIKYKRNQNILLSSALLFILLAGGLWSRLNFIRKSKAELQKEKDVSEGLLLNILPLEVADELKLKGYTDAKEFDQATILFTDFKGFTSMSEQMSASDLVEELNVCFKAFDGIMENHGLEKIKTIGDAYMAAGGLPVPDSAGPADVVRAGIEMQGFMINRRFKHDELSIPSFEMRVGIHTGPVIAGVVGIKKFQYDIWGDTVNTASRMESSGAVGKVNISNDTYVHVKEISEFTFENRGKIKAKGKGQLEMWFVT
jgi:adenylate cyclase